MGLWKRRLRRSAEPYAAVTDEERIARYVYLLNTLPSSVIERAHESAFKDLPVEKRREMFDRLRPFMTDAERVEKAEPALLARVLGRTAGSAATSRAVLDRAEADTAPRREPTPDERRWMLPFEDPILVGLIAVHFMASPSVVSYFTVGAGSLGLEGEPAWVGDIGGVTVGDTTGFDGGGFDGGLGGGFDGGGFGGGFDGGGFG